MQQIHSLENEELMAQYRAAGFCGTVGWGEKVALLVIDMAGAWTKPDLPLGSELGDVLENIQQLLMVARHRGDIPICFTTMGFDPSGSDMPLPARLKTVETVNMIRGSERTQLMPELDRRPDEVLMEKPRPSAFVGTILSTLLVQQRVDTVIVTGCSTSGCIRATCESAMDLGFRVIVPAEAVGDRSASAHAANLFDINARYADVLPIREVLTHLETGPGTGNQ